MTATQRIRSMLDGSPVKEIGACGWLHTIGADRDTAEVFSSAIIKMTDYSKWDFIKVMPNGVYNQEAHGSDIKEQDPDLFYVNASYNDCAQIFMQAKALNMDCQLVGPGMLLTEEFLDVVGNKIDGTIVMSSVPAFLPSVLESGELDAASKNFVDSYTAEYNEVPDGFAASAFDAVNIVLDAVAKVGTDTPALREELKTLRDYPGVSGYNMSFNEQKEMVKGIYLFEIQDGQFVRVK